MKRFKRFASVLTMLLLLLFSSNATGVVIEAISPAPISYTGDYTLDFSNYTSLSGEHWEVV